MSIKQEIISQKVGNGMTAGGSVTALSSVFGEWVTQNHEVIWFCMGVSGVIVGLIGLVIQLHFARKRDRREQELHELQLEEARLKRG